MKEYERRFVTKDGAQRVTIYRDPDVPNPVELTDFPLHFADWERNHSICYADNHYSHEDLLRRLFCDYGDHRKILDALISNGKKVMARKGDDLGYYLAYDPNRKGWALYEYWEWQREGQWIEAAFFDGSRDNIDLYSIYDCLDTGALSELIGRGCLTDDVRLASYDFGYYGSVSFTEYHAKCDGVAWLDKDEFLKYTRQTEEYWRGHTLRELAEWETEALEAFGDGEVYNFITEEKVVYWTKRTVLFALDSDALGSETEFEEAEWTEKDSCCGFYGDLDKILDNILEEAGYDKEQLTEIK